MSEGELPKSEEGKSLQANSKEEVAQTEGLDSEESDPSSFPLPKSVRQFIQSFSMTMGPGFPALGIMEKLKDEHITQFFDHVEAESKREAADRTSQRRYAFATLVFIVLAVFGFIVFIVTSEESDLLVPVLTYIATLVGGFGAGWGLGRRGRS